MQRVDCRAIPQAQVSIALLLALIVLYASNEHMGWASMSYDLKVLAEYQEKPCSTDEESWDTATLDQPTNFAMYF